MAKDIGMTIRKGIVVLFLPCLVAFWGFHPYNMFFHFFKCFFITWYYTFVVAMFYAEFKPTGFLDLLLYWPLAFSCFHRL